jgi:hypothetical protein
MRLASLPRQQCRGWSQAIIAFVGGQEKTTLRGDEGCMGCQRRDQRAGDMVHHLGRGSVLARTAALALAPARLDGALVQGGRLQPLRTGRQRLLRIRFTGKRRATQLLKGLGVGLTLLAPAFIHALLGLGAVMCGGAQQPALGHATIGGRQEVRAIALRQGLPRLRIGLGQCVLGCGQRGGNPGDPLTPRLRQGLEVLCTREGASGHEVRGPIGGVQWLDVLGDDLAQVLAVAAMATAGLHEEGNPRLVLQQ